MFKKLACLLLTFLLLSFVSTQAQAAGAKKMIKLETTMGDIVITLNTEKAPETSQNFIQYVEEGFFDGLIFHRVIDDFMIQGGGFTPDMKQKDGHDPIKNEADNGLKNNKYTLAMARTPDPHSASSQFFINTKDNDFLNFTAPTFSGWGYAVFGEVTEGREIVDIISKVKTSSKGQHGDVPVEDIIITKASVI